MWLTVSDGYRESQQMGRASMLKARTNMMLMRMLMTMRKVMLVGVADLLTFRNPIGLR